MAWYEQWFDRDEYELVYRERDESEAERVIDLILDRVQPAAGARILDVGCGRGRHAVEFASRGFDVTGLDLSEQSLKIAERRALDRGVEIRLIEGDMREPVETGTFDLVVNLFTAFGYFERESEHQRAVNAMAGALRPGGVLVQDFLNATYVRDTLVARDARVVDGAEIIQERWISENRINKEITLKRDDSTHSFIESVALLNPDDFRRMYERTGVVIESLLGDYDGSAYTPSSPRLILFSRRGMPSA